MKTAIAFLTTEPKEQTITFAYKIKQQIPNVEVFIICDYDGFIPAADGLVKIIQISDSECSSKGYKNATAGTHIQKTPNAIDKFFYFFIEKQTFNSVWLFEDDVFIPSIGALNELVKMQEQNNYDLIIPKLEKKTNDVMDWNWPGIVGKIEKPFWRTMLCCACFSANMLYEIKKYVDKNKTLFNSEVMPCTIAAQANMKIYCPKELRTIMWQASWGVDDILQLPLSIFHPIKNVERHEHLRYMVEMAEELRYEPANKLPTFLKEQEA